MPSPATLIAFGSASLLLLIVPGPAVRYIFSRGLADGRRTALAAVVGIEVGNFLYVVAATVGISAILATSALAFSAVKWLGVAYLVVVGIRTLATIPGELNVETSHTSARRAMTSGVIINALNPKVALFFLSFLPQFVDPGNGSPALQTLRPR
jgi:threonine/homoserine/homoserine lactone efflux protein